MTKHAGMKDAIAAMEAMVVADDDKLNDRASRRGHERAQDAAEREALEELAAGAAAAKATAKRKSSKRTSQGGTIGDLGTFDVGEDEDVEAHTSDSWGIVRRDVSIPNAAWRGELDDGCVAVCRVVGLASRAYVVLTGGFHYTFTVPHMRLYLQTTENAQLLQDLGGVAAIKGAPTSQAIGTRVKRKPVSRRASTPGMRLLLLSTLLLSLACGGQTADPGGSEDPMGDDLRGRPPAPHGDAELLATLQEWAARDRPPVAASPQPWESGTVAVADVVGSGYPSTIEQYLRQRDAATVRAQAELAHSPRPQSRRRPGWAVAAGHTPNLDTLQYWNEQWLSSAHWYDDPLFD